MAEPLISIRNLQKHFPIQEGILKRQVGAVKAVDGVNLDIERGSTVGLVGESGCGKTTFGKTLLHLTEPTGGTIRFNGNDITSLESTDVTELRRQIQMVYQDPDTSLNPRRTVRQTLIEPLKVHGQTENADEKVNEMLDRMGLDPTTYRARYPHELSGGERQRVGIGRALMLNPEFLVLDEPTSALDVSVQADILNLLKELQESMSLTMLFISHDLSVVNYLCDDVAVMYLGKIVEQGNTADVFEAPKHPYTEALFSALHPVNPDEESTQIELTGETPSPSDPPSGCSYHPRCHRQSEVGEVCCTTDPELCNRPEASDRKVACHLYQNPNQETDQPISSQD